MSHATEYSRPALALAWVLALAVGASQADGLDTAPATAWPMARGCLAGTGRSATVLAVPLEEAWRRDFPGGAFAAVPVIAAGTVFIGDLDGQFHALDLATGETRWTRTIDQAGFTSAAALAADPALPVVVGDDAGIVRGLDRKTGETSWEYVTDGEISGGPTILPTEAGPRVLVGSQDASLSCLDVATGKRVWTHSIADQIRCGPTVARTPAGDRVFLAGCDGRLHVIDAADGEELAAIEIGGPTGTTPAVSGDLVLFGTEGGDFFAIDFVKAETAWQKRPGTSAQAYRSSAAVGGSLALVGTRGRAVEAFEISTGERVWRQPLRGRVDASPVIVGVTTEDDAAPGRQAAIVADAKGLIVVLDVASGERVWDFDAGGGFSAGAAVAAGRLVIASDDGTIWCFKSAE
jgi:outer membrane protein assembly factor BamB